MTAYSWDKSAEDIPTPATLARKKRKEVNKPEVISGLDNYDSVNWGRREFLEDMLQLTRDGVVLSPNQAASVLQGLAKWQVSLNRALPVNLEALPPFHDPQVWFLALEWKHEAEARDLDGGPARYIYALLLDRIEKSNIRSNYQPVPASKSPDGSRNIASRPGWADRDNIPGWIRCVREMIEYYWVNYSPAWRNKAGMNILREFTDRQEFEALRDTVTRKALDYTLTPAVERQVSPEERKRNQQRRRRRT